MAEETSIGTSENVEIEQIIRNIKEAPGNENYFKTSDVVSKKDQRHTSKVLVIGGDTDDVLTGVPPSIIVEKGFNGQISKITVKCSCGQSAELLCEYD